MSNTVYIATSLDGYIADKEGKLDWLESIPNPNKIDFGYSEFIENIDALIMGRNTFETVLGFGIEWPYTKPVFVLSNSLRTLPLELKDKVELLNGSIENVLELMHSKGFEKLYIDGGKVIQSFLEKDLIDKLIITQVPILLGGGTSLFGLLEKQLAFRHVSTKIHLDALVQSVYQREKN